MRYRLLVGLVLLAAMLVAPVLATSLNFQNAEDYDSLTNVYCDAIQCYYAWTESATGGNNYYTVGSVDYRSTPILINPLTTNYAAATLLSCSGGSPAIQLYNSAHTKIYEISMSPSTLGRYEVKMSGGVAKVYVNGVNTYNSGSIVSPSYAGFGIHNPILPMYHCTWDDYVYGTNENPYIFGLPENLGSNAYAILHDTANSASDGLVFDVNNTQVNAIYFDGTWSRGSPSLTPTYTNESVNLVYLQTGTVYSTNYTGDSALTGSVRININNTLIGVNAPYGWYALNIPASGTYSNPLIYRSRGATITFDQDTYTTASTAVVTYDVEDAYWDPGTYNYRVDTMNVYGTIIDTQAVTTQTGTKNMAFASTDAIGVYYTVLIADPIASGSDVWMAYDYAELNAYVTFTGYVNDAETEAPMAAHINISQGSVAYDNTTSTPFDYTTNKSFYAGAVTDVNITASGYRQYTYSFTPLEAKTVALNFTLVPLSPTYDIGLAIGGVARETTYGRPIPTARVDLTNVTHSEACDTTTNSVGYYLADYGLPCPLTVNRNYQVWGSKTNYANSTIYNVTAEGAI